MNAIIKVFQGFLIGIATLVPGVSGGSMAIILNIYDELLHFINQMHRQFLKSITTLTLYGVGAVMSLYLLAPMICALLHYEYEIMCYLFMGIMCGGIRMIIKPCRDIRISWLQVIFFIIGLGIVFLMELTPSRLFIFETPLGLTQQLFLVLAGVIVAVALVLPGLSASFVLFMLGIYDLALSAAVSLYLPILIPLIIGLIFGTFLSANLIERCLTNYPVYSYTFILGIIVASILMMFPGVLLGMDLVIGLALFCSGFVLTYLMGKVTD